MIRTFTRILGFSLILISIGTTVIYADDQIESLQMEISRLEVLKDSLSSVDRSLIARSDSLSHVIDRLKSKIEDLTGVFVEYRLEKELRYAQKIAEKTQNVRDKMNSVESKLTDRKAKLRVLYQKEIDLLFIQLKETDSHEDKRQLIDKIKEYSSAKGSLKTSDKFPELGEIGAEDMEIERDDGPAEIRGKADLLSDIADKLKRTLEKIESKMKDLPEEKDARDKMQEFSEEISFFDEDLFTSRAIGSTSKEVALTSGSEGVKDKGADPTFVDNVSDAEGFSPSLPEEPAQTENVTELFSGSSSDRDIAPSGEVLSAALENVETEINKLRDENERLKEKFSNLKERARRLYHIAREMETAPENNR